MSKWAIILGLLLTCAVAAPDVAQAGAKSRRSFSCFMVDSQAGQCSGHLLALNQNSSSTDYAEFRHDSNGSTTFQARYSGTYYNCGFISPTAERDIGSNLATIGPNTFFLLSINSGVCTFAYVSNDSRFLGNSTP